MRSACNQIRFDFSTIDKETHPAGGYKPDQRLRDKKNYFETTSSRPSCKIHYGLTILTATAPFRRTSLTFTSIIFVCQCYIDVNKVAIFHRYESFPRQLSGDQILVGLRVFYFSCS